MIRFLLFTLFGILINKSLFAESEKIYLHYQDRPPYFIINKTSKKLEGGELFILIKKVMKEAEIPYEFQISPTSRSILAIKERLEKVCIPSAYITKDRQEFSHFSIPYYKDKLTVLAIRKEDKRFDKYSTFEDITRDQSLIPITKIGYSFGEYMNKVLAKNKNYISTELEKVDKNKIKVTSLEPEGILESVAHKDADYTYFALNEIQFHIKNNKKIRQVVKIKTLKDIVDAESRYFMCSKEISENTMKKINAAIKKVNEK
ncbi:transporter substrate-binding domain-containing protein [Fluviispira multicolorata]|uniref:Transporter substrate-binding domain-containing protein n=1 Tax=Fluviispira multicolorata TaxID=2654512 RepID=A0A833N615_9BACT|nr:transporter substrate-binding domain-containing protein [Fluviispira multicolorata]KAB8031974.1 transporter substrate-binding domain-containing protein [Fluviispira multicolorata]